MSEKASVAKRETPTASRSAASLTPDRINSLRRKCDCAGAAKSAGDCEHCGRERPTAGARFGHDFGRIRVRAERPADATEWATSASPALQALDSEQRLPAPTRGKLEGQFNQPLGGLRIHAGEEGRRVAAGRSALAVSEGANIYFGPGAYAPGTERGDRILRHEVAHYVQRQTRGRAGGRAWPARLLEAEADLAASRSSGPVRVRGRAAQAQPLYMKTYVSTVGGNPYLEQAVRFYKLWESEDSTRIGSYQDLVNELAKDKTALTQFRIVAHANGYNLFLPLLGGGKGYAELPALGLQTREALTVEFGALGHITSDMTGTVHGWLMATDDGKALLTKLGLTAAPAGVWKELIWWYVDEQFATAVKEDAPVTGGPKATTPAEKTRLLSEVQLSQKAVKAALPSSAAKADVDDLRTRVHAAVASKWTWGTVPAGTLKERLDRVTNQDVLAFRKEVEANTLEPGLKAVKGRVSDKTYIEIRGCNIGSNDAYLNGIREFFGTKPDKLPSISAPKMYQFFGTPGVQVLPPAGGKTPPVADMLKFLFEETFHDQATAASVQKMVNAAGLGTMADLVQVLKYADIKAEFDAWWKMKQKARGVADASVTSATLKDFQDFLSTAPPRTFPVNAPGAGTTSLWYLILLPDTAVQAMLAWVKDQGYTLPGGADPLKTFFKGKTDMRGAGFAEGSRQIVVDWMGDNYPVPDKIYFPEDPVYKANIRKLP